MSLLSLRLSSASDFITVAVGSDIVICEMTCKSGRFCFLERLPEVILLLEYNCDTHNYKSNDRINVSAASGCATIRNAQRSDTGRYEWRFYDNDVKVNGNHLARYKVMDKVSISNLTSRVSNSGLSTSLHVQFTGEQVTVTWSRDGGDLPEGHQLSDFNETLTVRSGDYGTYRVTVTNPVSEDHAECTLTAGQASCSGRKRWFWASICVGAGVVLALFCFVVWQRTRTKREQSKAQTKHESAGNASPGLDGIECAGFTVTESTEIVSPLTNIESHPLLKGMYCMLIPRSEQ